MDGTAFIFLNGFYPKGDMSLVVRLLKQTRPKPVLIAVDGGIAFLQRNKLKPDYWISDLDSAPKIKKGFLKEVEVLLFPSDKDKTDGELALDLCAEKGYSDITFLGWDARDGETDHLLGSLFLCRNLKGKRRHLRLRFVDSRQEIILIRNEARIVRGFKGRQLSIIPLSSKIVLTLKGTHYPAKALTVRAGETIALRNKITAERATIGIDGQGLAMIT